MIDQNFLLILAVSAFVGAASGYLGSIMVLRRLALAGDVLSHVALPGVALALIYQLNPFLAAFVFLAVASWLIWLLEKKTSIPTDAIVGVLFTAALAVGILITPQLELAEALFGDISKVALGDGLIAVVISVLIFIILKKIYKGLVLGIVSEDLAVASGIRLRKLDLLFLLLVAAIVAIGIKVIGTLLMGALVIVPATAAKNFSRSLKNYSSLSIVFGLISAPAGVYLARIFDLPPGPIVILVSIAIFLLSLLGRKY